jgi:hypothetical protein
MSSKFKIRSVLICDDIRQEVSGKEILIGVYNDSMLFNTFPARLRQLVIRTVIDMIDKSVTRITLSLKDPNGTALGNFVAPLNEMDLTSYIAFGFGIQDVVLYSPGPYSIYLSADDDPEEKISDFEVRLPQNEVERARIPKGA